MDADTFSLLRDTVRRFVVERLIPNEDRVEHEDAVPEDIIAEMRELGLFGLTVPEEYGGLGLSSSEEVQVIYELGRTSFAYRSVIGTTVGIGSQGIVMDGTPDQKAEWLPGLATGMFASFALTEPDAGSDAASIKTSAVIEGDNYRVKGTKRFITNAPHAGMFTLMAHAARHRRSGRRHRLYCARRHAGDQLRQARQEDGAEGYDDVRLMRIYEGTSQIQQTIIAKALLRDAGLKL